MSGLPKAEVYADYQVSELTKCVKLRITKAVFMIIKKTSVLKGNTRLTINLPLSYQRNETEPASLRLLVFTKGAPCNHCKMV